MYQLDLYIIVGTVGEYGSKFTANDVDDTQKAADAAFSGNHTDPETGVSVTFEFSVKVLGFSFEEVQENRKGEIKTKKQSKKMTGSNVTVERNKLGQDVDKEQIYGLEFGQSFPALVAAQDNIPNTDGGAAAEGIKVDRESPDGFSNALGHEMVHFMLAKSSIANEHKLGGLVGRPITKPLINKSILKQLKKNVPRASDKDRTLE